MQALCDHPWTLPYTAAVPWPLVIYNGQPDWIESIHTVENWLEQAVGPHYVQWVWSTWTLHQTHLCAVSFAREKNQTLFLRKWGS